MNILYAVTGWLCTFLGGAQDKLTVLESALRTIGLFGGGSGTSGKKKQRIEKSPNRFNARKSSTRFSLPLLAYSISTQRLENFQRTCQT